MDANQDRKMRQVLLLDDNAAQLMVRELVLRRAGFECHVATNVPGALALLRTDVGKDTIGVVITDHFMPGTDGVEFVRQLRSFKQELPAILISGLPDAEVAYPGVAVTFRVTPCD